MNKRIAAGAVAVVAAAAVGLAPAASAKASDYSTKKKNQLWSWASKSAPELRIIGKKDVIETAVITCDALRSGLYVEDLVPLIAAADPIIHDGLITITAGAPVFLCPDQQYKFD